jgi:hypothetical protein
MPNVYLFPFEMIKYKNQSGNPRTLSDRFGRGKQNPLKLSCMDKVEAKLGGAWGRQLFLMPDLKTL